MLDSFFNQIFGPFRTLRSTIFRIKQTPQNIKGQFSRAGNEARSFGADAKGALARGKEVSGKAQSGMQGVKGAQKAGSAASLATLKTAKTAKTEKMKMGFFSRSKKCPGCGQKLHVSWEECPYCGWGKAAGAGPAPSAARAGGGGASAPAPSAAAAGGAPQRTMALDLSAGPPTGTGILGWFIPLEGTKTGELFELRGRITVGSKDDNQIVVPEPSISGHHCEFIGSSAGFKINDLGSTNGTYVNDKRIQSHDLVDNDNVTLGKVRFKFKSLV